MVIRRPSFIGAAQMTLCTALFLYLTGCASGNYRQADTAASSLQRAAVEISAENRAIDNSIAALDDLVNKPAADLKPQFEVFGASVDHLAVAADRAQKAADHAHDRCQDYFKEWEKDSAAIKFDAVREQSVSRKTQVSDEFNTVNQRYRENQAVVQPLISYLRDIRTALSTDLTAGGIGAARPLAENAQQNARKVQVALARLADDLSFSGTQMSSVMVDNSAARGGVGDATQNTQQRAQANP
jgi:hypothetical protein